MATKDYSTEIILSLVEEYPQFPREVYFFMQDAISFTLKQEKAFKSGIQGHISGKELLEGIRVFSLKKFGPMAADVFNEWGINCTEDFGIIVFKMVQYKLLTARDEDTLEDFKDGFDFREAFVSDFLPTKRDQDIPKIA